MRKNITVLGATGSIGTSTLDVIRRHPEQFRVFALTGHSNTALLAEQAGEFQPDVVVAGSESAAGELKVLLGSGFRGEILWGPDALIAVAEHADVDYVMAAIVGAAGLAPNLAAVNAGKRVLLANKESLVTAGALFMEAVGRSGATLLPIDSEHNAIFQCLPAGGGFASPGAGVSSVLLTASGGPFRDWSAEAIAAATPAQAVAHPNWSMGQKISVDSASLMNKGLELIEACWLFGIQPDQVEVVVHPQSIIHSMVRYIDGSVIAQMGNPDMRTPIAYGLGWPERIGSGVAPLDFLSLSGLNFEAPDLQRFPCLKLAMDAFVAGGTSPAVLNAANEVSVQAFLDGRIGFMDIARINGETMAALPPEKLTDIEMVMETDRRARKDAALRITQLAG